MAQPRTIQLMADYHSSPLWEPRAEPYNLDLATLPIDRDLQRDLRTWATEYDNTLNLKAPWESGFASPNAHARWLDEGRVLAARLADQLDSTLFTVEYVHEHDKVPDLEDDWRERLEDVE